MQRNHNKETTPIENKTKTRKKFSVGSEKVTETNPHDACARPEQVLVVLGIILRQKISVLISANIKWPQWRN